MKKLLILLNAVICFQVWGQIDDTLYFQSERELANYAYQNTNFSALNVRFFKDRMFDYDPAVFDDYCSTQPGRIVHAYHAFQLSKHVENWDVQEAFQADSVLYPIMSRFHCLDGQNAFHLPLIIMDLDVFELKENVKQDFEENTVEDELRALIPIDLNQKRIGLACLPLDSLNYPNVWLDLDERFIVENTGRNVDYVTISDGVNSIIIFVGQSVDISSIYRNGSTVTIATHFDDNSVSTFEQNIYYIDQTEEKSGPKAFLDFTEHTDVIWPYDGQANPSESYPEGILGISYACSDQVLRKPYLMIAGWGPYTDNSVINSALNWPTPMWKMANQMNQNNLIELLNQQGYDVAILQLVPPNAYIEGNATVIEAVIKRLNLQAAENGYHEELVVHGFSAGALGARLALQRMEKKHLEENGPHPHTKLYVSTDGEHLGANVPLGVQSAVQYLWDYERDGYNFPKIYALRYILRAPQSREIVRYWYEEIDAGGNVSHDDLRGSLIQYQIAQNHYLSDVANKSGFPGFLRMISLSNGRHTPSYTGYTAAHTPLPSETGKLVFEDADGRHRSKIRYLTHGESEVFLYRKRTWGKWAVKMRTFVNNALVLDNAAGGIMFIEENPINKTLQLMDQETFGEASTLYYTNFCFTPTVFTHNIKNFYVDVSGGYINYNLREQGLMYRYPDSVLLSWEDGASQYYGYPHLRFPTNHYSITPFDAIFTGPIINEHLRFNFETCDEERRLESFQALPLEPIKSIYRDFILGEAEGLNLYLQNRNIGFYKRPDHIYYVDFTAKNRIEMGEHVSNKTDFRPMSVEESTVVMAMAKNEINLKPGVHFKLGSSVHLVIGENACEKSGSGSHASNGDQDGDVSGYRSDYGIDEQNNIDVIIFPNPSVSSFKIRYLDQEITQTVHMTIYDLNGIKLMDSIVPLDKEVDHSLSPGTYIVQLKLNELWISKRLVVDPQ